MSPNRDRAVVIGASLGGLLAARVLAQEFTQVTILERDALPAPGEHRRGVPQSHHAHGLLARGREALEELYPGLSDELVAGGASRGDVQADLRWINEGRRLNPATSGLVGLVVSRPLLEGALRERTDALPNVEVVGGARVHGLTATESRVTGVRFGLDAGDQTVLPADLVVDASGRASQTPAWLRQLGYDAPAEDEIRVDIVYATRVYRRVAPQLDGDLGIVDTATPERPRTGVVLAIEGDRWIVTLAGYGDDAPPTDPDGWVAFAHTLSRPDVAELIDSAEPLDQPRSYRYPSSRRRRYERLRRFPSGYLVFGDALCSFNPAYGQGMTVAALEALALRTCLGRDDASLADDFFRRAARIIDIPWEIAATNDLRFSSVTGRPTVKMRLVNRYVARLHVVAERDPHVGLAFLRVLNLIDRPERLMAPATLRRVLRGPGRAASIDRSRAEGGHAPAST